MATITQSIGSGGGRDFSTLQSWEDALPANLVTDGNSYVGEVYNDSEFVSSTRFLTIAGHTTDASHTITLRAASGQSFRDNPNVQTNRLAYVPANGVAIRLTGNYQTIFYIDSSYVTISGLQLKSTGISGQCVLVGATIPTNLTVENCIIQCVSSAASPIVYLFGATHIIRNCLVIAATSTTSLGIGVYNGASAVGVTLVRPTNYTAGGKSFASLYATAVVRDCAIFGFTTNASGSYNSDGHNACESGAGTIPGSTGNLTSVAYSTATFVQPSAASNLEDFRLVAGSALVDAGVTDTTAIPASDDIAGTTRPQGSAWDIGCWELIQFKPAWAQTQAVVGDDVMYLKNTGGQYLGFALINAQTGAAISGASVTSYRTIDGGAQAATTNSATSLGNGQYRLELSAADTNGNDITFLFTATSAVPVEKTIVTEAQGESSKGFPYFFPSLFGNGADGDLTASNESDIGYMSAFGVKNYGTLVIPAGVTWTIAQGTSSGAALIAASNKITIEGSIIGSGGNGGNATISISGAGGATAGGGTGGVSTTGPWIPGSAPTALGHGTRTSASDQLGRGGSSGSFVTGVGGAWASGTPYLPILDTASTYALAHVLAPSLLQRTSGRAPWNPYGVTTVVGTGAANATVSPVLPTTANYGPWAQAANTKFLSLHSLPGIPGGIGGAVNTTGGGLGGTSSAGGGGGSAGILVLEAPVIELVPGYAITFTGGNGGNATSSSSSNDAQGGAGGHGGLVILICRQLIGSTSSINVSGGSFGTKAGSGSVNNLAGLAGEVLIFKV